MIAFSMTGVVKVLFAIMVIATAGYALGAISIKGVSLGTAGVFITALLFGIFFPHFLDSPDNPRYASVALKIVENIGLVFFVTAVGFIAGPNFFHNFKKNFKSYILLGIVIILAGALTAIGCIYFGRITSAGDPSFDPKELTAMVAGLLSGSLTSTPAFSAAKEAVEPAYENVVSVGHGIAYLFGVIGVVLFVQIVPKLSHANMEEERKLLIHASEKKKTKEKRFELDPIGMAPFCAAALLGILLGCVKIGHFFSLGMTGGTLLVSLILGHCAHVGKISLIPKESMLKVMRELGLFLFLIGAGIGGGISFVRYFQPVYFLYGVLMTLVPMIIGFLFAKYVMHLSLLNNLGSIAGGMTSTPALGSLIHSAGSEDVASAYAATYPVALLYVVLVSEFLILFF